MKSQSSVVWSLAHDETKFDGLRHINIAIIAEDNNTTKQTRNKSHHDELKNMI